MNETLPPTSPDEFDAQTAIDLEQAASDEFLSDQV
jgi:hypothetical protein